MTIHSGSVSIAGTATQGQTLTASNNIVDPDGITSVISYQWQAAGIDILGATSNTLTLGQAQVGTVITVTANYTDLTGIQVVTSAGTDIVTNINDTPTGSISITGTATEGQTLNVSDSLADIDGLGALTYQWKANGIAIPGANGTTHTLLRAQVGTTITVTISYTDGQGAAESQTSAPTSTVAPLDALPVGSVLISGTTTQGQVLTATNTITDADGIVSLITYQWKQNGVSIAGETNSTLTLSQSQVGKAISVTASYTDAKTNIDSLTSTTTAMVANVNDAPTGAVAITGTSTQGQTLTASHNLADLDGLGTIVYQWRADGVAITGATGSTLTPSQAQVAKVITVSASYTDLLGALEISTSAATGAVANINDVPTGGVSIAGTPTQGQVLTASNTLADIDGIGTITYQWRADGIDIAGATANTLKLSQAEVGKAITVVASYTDIFSTSESAVSNATALVTNLNDAPTGNVTIAGTATQGQTLTASNTLSDLDGLGSISYQWKADGTNISGATGSTLTLAQAQVKKVITVVASYTDLLGTAQTMVSAGTSAIANMNDVPTGAVTITGTATRGQTLSLSNTLVDIDGLGSFSYQWKADGVPIAGATATTLNLAQATVGKLITVTASYTDGFGFTESITSGPTASVSNPNASPTGLVKISGTPTKGLTLTATNTLADADGLGIITYQWKADGIDIVGAVSNTLTLAQAQVGKAITVTANYIDLLGKAEAVSSTATTNVAFANTAPTGTVTIAGTATRDQTLTASNTLADVDGLGTIRYQWKAGGSIISGATSNSLTLNSTLVGKVITVTASYTDILGTAESVTSAGTAKVTNINAPPTGSVVLAGTAAQGQQLVASHTLADIDGLGNISYQWGADGIAISGANSNTLMLTQALVGKSIAVTASYMDLLGTAESVTSIPTSSVANINDSPTGVLVITGETTQGLPLGLNSFIEDIDGLGTVAFQWNANGNAIAGANADTFVPGVAQIGKALTVTASYVDGYGAFESVTSAPTETVKPNSQAPVISGAPVVKQHLTLGESIGLGNIVVSDPNFGGLAKLVLTLSANNGVFSMITSPADKMPALQLSGTAAEINTTLQYLNFASLAEGGTSIQAYLVNTAINLPTGISIQFDSLSNTIPGLPPAKGVATIPGDGNGDGIADATQAAVSSAVLSKSSKPGTVTGATTYVTLVADSAAGKLGHPQLAQPVIHSFLQADIPNLVPASLSAPLGTFTFTAIMNSSEKMAPFSVYLDADLGINGYWIQNASGYWTNLALPANGGNMVIESGKLRLDFQVEDGSTFDIDGLVNGIIVNSGIAGSLPLSLMGQTPASTPFSF